MKTLSICLSAALLAASVGACKKDEAAKPAPAPAAKPEPEPAAAAAAKPEPAVAKPAAYSPEAAVRLLGELEKCEYDFSCDAYKPLVGFGAPVARQLAEFAADKGKPAKGRAVAAKAFGEIKDPAAGQLLFDAAKTEEDFMLRGELFAAAGASGNETVLAAAGAYLMTEEGDDRSVEVRKALAPFGKKAFDWAAGELSKGGKAVAKYETELADVITDTATAAELEALKGLLAKAKDEMAKNRLASKAIELGDTASFEVLYKHLADKDEYVRADAGNFLARVVDKIPAADKAKVLELVKAARAKDQGGLTSAGFDELLQKLGS